MQRGAAAAFAEAAFSRPFVSSTLRDTPDIPCRHAEAGQRGGARRFGSALRGPCSDGPSALCPLSGQPESESASAGPQVDSRSYLGLDYSTLAGVKYFADQGGGGPKGQQIQRSEATDFTAASGPRLKQVIEALGIRVHADIFLASPKASG